MQCGHYDQRISIYSEAVTSHNTFGEDVNAATPIGTFWAEVKFLAGRELEVVQQRFAEARYSICMRRQPGVVIEREDKITWGTLTLDILDVQGPGTRMDEWAITAKDYVR